MKKGLLHLVLATILLTACQQKQQIEPSTNLFSTLLGKNQAEVDARIDSLWVHFFTPSDLSRYEVDGEKTVYYEVGDSMGIIVDTGSNDVRTEGMSYGMMISLQLDKRTVFDKLVWYTTNEWGVALCQKGYQNTTEHLRNKSWKKCERKD